MNAKHCLFFLFLVTLFWRCTTDEATPTDTNDTESFTLATDDKLEQELQQLMTKAKEGLNAPIGLRSGTGVVELPAGSVDALQSAVQAAAGGIVLIRAGEHYESGTVTIDQKVTILSEKGAVLIANTTPSPVTTSIELQPVVHILDAPGVFLSGLEIRPEGEAGSVGILVENSPGAKLLRNTILHHQFSILFENSNSATAYYNKIVATPLWQTGQLVFVQGIININGQGVRLTSNDISGGVLGIWACSSKGLASGNYLHGNFVGLLLCKAAENSFKFPDGHLVGSQLSGNKWLVTQNNAANNLDCGYLVMDGANHNLLQSNFASNNTRVDYEVAAESYRFGLFAPKAFDNTLYVRRGQTVKDCGQNSTIRGGVRIDTSAVPCF